ncbi:glycosyltransferase involved in cell wall biosynthesis [Algoriphagus ratkowskyi]|nr:glycosyltransferase involved in cell wall biosynthesis [Algoriphagus ratkowskyi]
MNGIFIHQQVKALQELGCECHVVQDYNWFPSGGLHKYHSYWHDGYNAYNNCFRMVEGITIHPVATFIKMPNRLFPDNYYDRLAKSFSRYIKKTPVLKDADWIYAHFLTDFAFIGTKVKELTGIKLASIARGDDVHAWPEENPSLLDNIRTVFLKSDLLFANSKQLGIDANMLLLPSEQQPVHVVYNGVDLNKFRPVVDGLEKQQLRDKFDLKADKKYILCVATPVALKGWLLLLDALAEVKDEISNWELICVAVNRSTSDALNLKTESSLRGIENFVNVVGQVFHDDLADLYRACDAFVLASYNEGMANALLEAAATNLRVIASDVGGHSEIFVNSSDLSLVQPGSVSDLKIALQKLFSSDLDKPSGTRQMVLKVGSYQDNARKILEKFNQKK